MADATLEEKIADIVDKAMQFAYNQGSTQKVLPVKEAATKHYVTEIVKLFPDKKG